MNALELLHEDHEKVEALFEEVKASPEENGPKLFDRIRTELEIHTHIEETIFYPMLKEQGDDELRKIVLEGIEEHRQVKTLLGELDSLVEDSEKFEPKLKVVMENVEHHVEEEEGEMFPLIEAQFDEATLDDLGSRMEAEKRTFARSAKAGG